MEIVCEKAGISLNKNAIYGDRSALSPGGVRVGTPALTSRGLTEQDIIQVEEYLHSAEQVAQAVMAKAPSKKLKEFVPLLDESRIANGGRRSCVCAWLPHARLRRIRPLIITATTFFFVFFFLLEPL